MDDTKHPLKSLGIVGPLCAILVLAANHVKPGLGLTGDDVAPAIDAADALAGCVLGIVGRWRATKRISLTLLALCVALSLQACSGAQVAETENDANNAVAAAQPTIAMACWLAEAADAGFQVYATTPGANAAAVADEAKAMAGVAALCAAPAADAADAVAQVLAAYKAIVAATPAAAGGA